MILSEYYAIEGAVLSSVPTHPPSVSKSVKFENKTYKERIVP